VEVIKPLVAMVLPIMETLIANSMNHKSIKISFLERNFIRIEKFKLSLFKLLYAFINCVIDFCFILFC
jgi:hypothetical protein